MVAVVENKLIDAAMDWKSMANKNENKVWYVEEFYYVIVLLCYWEGGSQHSLGREADAALQLSLFL